MLFGILQAAEELILYVPPEEAKAVIERNEMQYEEYNWHSFPDRIRIAKINISLLKKAGKNLQITPFDDVTPIIFTSKGIRGSKWKGERIQGKMPEEPLREAATGDQATFDLLKQALNVAELNIVEVFKDPQTGEYVVVPADFETLPTGHNIGERVGTVPVVPEDVEVITKVYGSISTSRFPEALVQGKPHDYSIKPLYNDVEYVIIYEWDVSKDYHLLEALEDSGAFEQSEMGQRYKQLREDKAAYMARVSERIANRNKSKEE